MTETHNHPLPTSEQMKKAVEMMYLQECNTIQASKFATEQARVQVLLDAGNARKTALEVLDLKGSDEHMAQKQDAYEKIRHFGITSIWSSIDSIKNMKLRAEYNTKIKKIARSSLEKCEAIKPGEDGTYTASQLEEIEDITQKAIKARDATPQMLKAKNTEVSAEVSAIIKETNSPHSLIEKYKGEYMERVKINEGRILPIEFSEWEGVDQVAVYTMIVEASGRPSGWVDMMVKAMGYEAEAMIVFVAGMFVWDIIAHASDHWQETVLKDTLEIGVGTAGQYVAAEVMEAALGAFDASAPFAPVAAIVAGFIAVFAIGLAFESLFEAHVVFFKTFPKTMDQQLWGQPMLYNFPLPDGPAILRQAMHA